MIDESLRKFLLSEYAHKILLAAKLMGQENYKHGKKLYKVDDLLKKIEVAKQMY